MLLNALCVEIGKDTDEFFEKNQKRMSISGAQDEFSLLLDKTKLQLYIIYTKTIQ